VSLGREVAYYASAGGESILGVGFVIGVTVIGVLVAAVTWPIVAALAHRSVVRALVSVGLAAGVLAAGMAGGAATAGLSGGTYHDPVYLQANAKIQANLSGTGLGTAMVDGAVGHCQSDADSREIASIEMLDLGAFGTGRLRGLLVFNPDGSVDGWAMIDGSDSDPEALGVRWAGTLRVMSISRDRSSGDVFFPDVALDHDAKLPGATVAPEWPRSISGDISWECQPFTD
jgi:hypothetical protein